MTGLPRSAELTYAEALQCLVAVHRALDASDASALILHFSPEAVWHRPERALKGHAAIEAMVLGRDPSRTTAHMVGNLALSQASDGWIARYNLTVYVGTNGIGGFVAVLSCEDRLIQTESGPRITEKRATPLLRPGATA